MTIDSEFPTCSGGLLGLRMLMSSALQPVNCIADIDIRSHDMNSYIIHAAVYRSLHDDSDDTVRYKVHRF